MLPALEKPSACLAQLPRHLGVDLGVHFETASDQKCVDAFAVIRHRLLDALAVPRHRMLDKLQAEARRHRGADWIERARENAELNMRLVSPEVCEIEPVKPVELT